MDQSRWPSPAIFRAHIRAIYRTVDPSQALAMTFLLPSQLTCRLQILLGDFVSLWRAYTVFGRPRWLYILSACIAAVETSTYRSRSMLSLLKGGNSCVCSNICQFLNTVSVAAQLWIQLGQGARERENASHLPSLDCAAGRDRGQEGHKLLGVVGPSVLVLGVRSAGAYAVRDQSPAEAYAAQDRRTARA